MLADSAFQVVYARWEAPTILGATSARRFRGTHGVGGARNPTMPVQHVRPLRPFVEGSHIAGHRPERRGALRRPRTHLHLLADPLISDGQELVYRSMPLGSRPDRLYRHEINWD